MGYDEKELEIPNAFDEPEKYSLETETIPTDIPDLWAVKKRRVDQSSSFFGPNVLQICRQCDLVFIALHGANGENGKVQATFDILGIDYTGTDYFSSAVSSNKIVSKQLFINKKIPVPKGYLIKKGEPIIEPKQFNINYPVIVKPNNGGIGLGITVANDKTMYMKAIKEAFKWESEILIEEFVMGREFSVGILNGTPLPVLEVLPLNTKDKKTGKLLSGQKQRICPAQIDDELAEELMNTAKAANDALGLHVYSKTDFILRSDGTFVCLECDSLPHLNEESQLVEQAMASGVTFEQFVDKVIELSLRKGN